jgi:hypothetical protein
MMKKAAWIGLALSTMVLASALGAAADEKDNKTILTFSQAVEIPGHVLPAGTYTFKLMDSMSDRHIVQVFNADESQIIATLLAIPDYRLTATDKTVIKFGEVPAGSPEAIRAWFYPGNTTGQEFVYPRARAIELAKSSNAIVPAMAVDTTNTDELKTTTIVAISPDAKETSVTASIQTTPAPAARPAVQMAPMTTTPPAMQMTAPKPTSAPVAPVDHDGDAQLPKTASSLPLVLAFGIASIGIAAGVMAFGKRRTASAR